MQTKNQELTPDESLRLINEMILKAKRSFTNMSFYFILWGVLLFAAGILEYYLDRVIHYEHSYMGWPIVGVLGAIASSVKGARDERKAGATAYMDKVFMFLWMGFMITLLLLIIGTVGNQLNPGSFIIILTGLPTFVSGGVMRFRPLIIGGIIFWAIGIGSFFLLDEYRSLLFSLSILMGYIIPGLLLKRAENEQV